MRALIQSSFLVALASVLSLGSVGSVSAQDVRTFRVDGAGGSRIQFVSDAPLETITGVTSKLGGTITVDLKAPSKAKGTVTADVDSIRTGVDLRDEHLRADNWLDAKRYPKATFELVSVSGIDALEPNKGATATVKGKFSLHGVTLPMTAKARVRLIPASSATKKSLVKGDILRVQVRFVVKLEDYKVSVPSVVRLKVANEITVNVDLRATAQ